MPRGQARQPSCPTKSFGSLKLTPERPNTVVRFAVRSFITEAPATATRSSPPSAACRNTDEVGPPIWIELDSSAAGMFELMPISTISASRPRRLKMPSSMAIIAEAQSLVAVQPICTFCCACAAPASINAPWPPAARMSMR